MHILIIPPGHFITSKKPSSGIFQYEQAKALARVGHRIGVISVGFITMRYVFREYPYIDSENDNLLNIRRKYKRSFLIERFLNLNFNRRRYLSLFKSVYRKYELEYGRPDLVHAHNLIYSGFLAEWLWQTRGVPFVLTEHSSAFARELVPEYFDRELMKVILKARVATCVSKRFCDLLQKRFNHHFQILHNIVDRSFFLGSLPARTNGSTFVFLNIASLDHNKNQELLLRAFAAGFKGTSAQLRIGGEGPLKRALIRSANELGIAQQVVFLGELSRAEVGAEMRSAQCFVLSSNHETFGVVLIEALASGLPLIATRSGGPEDIISKDNGLLVAVGSEQELRIAMQYIRDNHAKYSPDELRSEALENFGESAFVRQVSEIYRLAIARKNQLHTRMY